MRGQHSAKSDKKSSLMQASDAGTESGRRAAPDHDTSSDDSDFERATHIGSQKTHKKSSLMQASSDSEDGASLRWSSKALTSSDGDSTDDVTHSPSHMRPQVRHKKSRRTRRVLVRGSDESDLESTVPQKPKSKKKSKRSALQPAPKLFYDGKEEWEIFQDKFQDYAEQMDWSPTECKACLTWCLRGKGSKFCNALLGTHEDISCKRLLKKLADKFGDNDFRAAAVSKFNQAHQKKR